MMLYWMIQKNNMYRIVETNICDEFQPKWATFEYKIQRRIFFVWFDVIVDLRYVRTIKEARRWIRLTKKGYKTRKVYYE